MGSQIMDELLDDHLESFVRDSPPGVLLMPFDHEHDALLRQSPDFPADDPINDRDSHGRGGRGGSTAPRNIPETLFVIGSLPSEYSESPNKRVQFEVGGGDDDEHQPNSKSEKTMSQPNIQSNGPGNLNSDSIALTTPSRPSRADARDYLVQPGSAIALLPAIAEERFGRSPLPPFYGRTISIDQRHPDGDKEIYGFVQLDVLTGGDGVDVSQRDWKETARWIKYEEDLEEGADRWGRPHIASLSFHSLIKLRKLIERDGVIMLDLEEKDMPGVAYRIVEELSGKGLIRSDESPLLMRALLLKHKHVQEQEAPWFKLRRSNTSSASALNSMLDEKNRNRSMIDPSHLVRRNSATKPINEISASSRSLQRTASGNYLRPANVDHVSVEVKPVPISDMYCPSEEDLKWIQGKENMIKRLPTGAEATMVMVGDFEGINKPIFVFVRLAEAAFMFNVTEIPVPARFFSILLVPLNMEIDLLEIGRAFGALMSNRQFYEVALTATGRKNLLTGINEFLDDSIVLPPGDWDNEDLLPLHVLQSKTTKIKKRRLKKQMSFVMSNDSFCAENGSVLGPLSEVFDTKTKDQHPNPFERTGRPFGGLIQEVCRRIPRYKSDFTDGLNFQCFATIIFIYCASIAQVITFAGLMSEKTNNLIGISETLMSTSGAGVFFALFSGQPLIPIGPTGPLLVFDEILFGFCQRHDIEFLTARVWISIWLFIFATILVCVEGSVLVKWCTRFTQDLFAVLTSVLLIYECIDNLIEVYVHHPLGYEALDTRPISLTINTTHYSIVYEETTQTPIIDESEDLRRQPNTALLCTILVLGTFFIAYFLREFRNSVFLGERARRALGDFGVPIAVITMVFLDYSATDTYTQKMKVPAGLEPSNPDERGWVISPLGRDGDFNLLIALGSILPAMLVFILIFMTTQICELIVNKKERKLVKGTGYHLDIFLISIINLGAGFMGAPWLCCATVRGLAHVTALTVYSENNPPGEKPTIVAVREQRVTCLVVALLIGCSVLMAPVLQFIPLAVLFGVFLYMGVSSLNSTQLFERFRLLFIPVSSHPQTIYVRRVRTWKMHMYTMIQLGCLAMLWGVKSVREAALAFPFVLMFLVPIRLQLKHLFNESELEALDGDP